MRPGLGTDARSAGWEARSGKMWSVCTTLARITRGQAASATRWKVRCDWVAEAWSFCEARKDRGKGVRHKPRFLSALILRISASIRVACSMIEVNTSS